MGDPVEEIAQRLRRLDVRSLTEAQAFIARWGEFKECYQAAWPWVPVSKLWDNFVAGDPEVAQLFGVRVNPLQHRPHVTVGCFAPCRLCDAENPAEEGAGEKGTRSRQGTRRELRRRSVTVPDQCSSTQGCQRQAKRNGAGADL